MESKQNGISKSTLVIFVSAVMAAVLLVTMLLIGTQTVAWFRSVDTFTNDAQISNFVTAASYSQDGGATWTLLQSGDAIITTPDTVNDLQLQISYHGEHAAYLRVSVYGSFYNADTDTYLPQPVDFWSFDGYDSADWLAHEGYLYYTHKLADSAAVTTLPSFSILAALPDEISAYQDYEGELYIVVDAVQPDRYPVFWGVSALPWQTTTTTA